MDVVTTMPPIGLWSLVLSILVVLFIWDKHGVSVTENVYWGHTLSKDLGNFLVNVITISSIVFRPLLAIRETAGLWHSSTGFTLLAHPSFIRSL